MAAVSHEGARALGGLKVGRDDGVGFTGDKEWAQDTQTKGKKPNDFENQDHSSGPTKTWMGWILRMGGNKGLKS